MLGAVDRSQSRKQPNVLYTLARQLRLRKPAAEGPILPADAEFYSIRVQFKKGVMGGYEADVHEDGKPLMYGVKIMRGVDSVPLVTQAGTIMFTLIAEQPGNFIELKFLE